MAAEPSGRTLAFLGDVTWSYYVRRYLVETRLTRGSDLQRHAVRYESAKAQAEFYRILHEEGFFTEEEEEAYRRGRNDHTGTVPNRCADSAAPPAPRRWTPSAPSCAGLPRHW